MSDVRALWCTPPCLYACMIKAQSRFDQLRLVCHKFNEVFKSNQRLSRNLLLPSAFTEQSLSSVLTWIPHFGASVKNFGAYINVHTTPSIEAVLWKLMPPQTTLESVCLSGCSDSSVKLVSRLTSLTCCKLKHIEHPQEDPVDLTPLTGLANLQELHIFSSLVISYGLPAHLTNLVLDNADLSASGGGLALANSCVTSLRKLDVNDAQMSGLHPGGLLACTILEEFMCCRGLVTANMQDDKVDLTDDSAICLPAFSTLTSLSELWLVTKQKEEVFDLAPLHALSLLQHLHVECDHADLDYSEGLSSLQKLTFLLLNGPDQGRDDELPLVTLNVDWSSMQNLQNLTIDNLKINCNSSIVQLTALRHLSEIQFSNSRPVQSGVKFFSLLVYRLAKSCPQVELSIDDQIFG